MDTREAKQKLRERLWTLLEAAGAARFPGARGRIPNFDGADEAAARLAATEPWSGARTLKCNPDMPQAPVRRRALEAGKNVYMAVPRLRDPRPFLRLDPTRLTVPARRAATIRGAGRYGEAVPLDALPHLDLVVAGSVAVAPDGARLGKGGGYSDLEFALAAAAGRVSDRTIVATTVHPLQVLAPGTIPMTEHDVPVDLIVTPDAVIPTARAYPRPAGILWAELTDDRIAAIPVLRAWRERGPPRPAQ